MVKSIFKIGCTREIGITIKLKQRFKLLEFNYACNNNLKQNLNNLKYWDSNMIKDVTCLAQMLEDLLLRNIRVPPESSKSTREDEANSNKIQINSKLNNFSIDS